MINLPLDRRVIHREFIEACKSGNEIRVEVLYHRYALGADPIEWAALHAVASYAVEDCYIGLGAGMEHIEVARFLVAHAPAGTDSRAMVPNSVASLRQPAPPRLEQQSSEDGSPRGRDRRSKRPR
jgi:hypothetical protein